MNAKDEKIIARRTLEHADTGEAIELSIEKPRQFGKAWKCVFAFRGRGVKRRGEAYGEDGLQALTVALEGARQMSIAIGATRWLGEEGNGLPTYFPSMFAFGPRFAESVERLVARKEKAFVARLERRRAAKVAKSGNVATRSTRGRSEP